MSGMEIEMGCNSKCVSLAVIVFSLVYLCTQIFLFHKHLQYKQIDKAITPTVETKVPMVEKVHFY